MRYESAFLRFRTSLAERLRRARWARWSANSMLGPGMPLRLAFESGRPHQLHPVGEPPGVEARHHRA